MDLRRAELSFENMSLKKGSWSREEDHKLVAYIKRYGIWNWGEMPKAAGLLRSGKSCRLRWVNYLRPGIKRGNFSREEQETIFKMHGKLGNKWSAIAAALPGRTDNEIKNHWHAHLKKRLRELGTQSQVSSNTEAPMSDGPRNVPVSAQPPPSSLCSSPNAGAAVWNNENQNLEADFGSDTFEELLSLWEEPLSEEILYMENLQEISGNPGFVLPQCELWCSEPISPYGFYNDAISDLSFNINLSVPADMAGVKEPNLMSIFK